MLKIPGPIPISIYPFFWLLAAAIGWLNTEALFGTFVWIFIIFFSVLFHEFGHALTAVSFGQKAHIELVGFGGVTKREGISLKPWQDFLIVLNGPIAGFILAGLCLWSRDNVFTVQKFPLFNEILTVSFYVNVFWTVVNLMPVQPLDGGKLLGIVLEYFFGVRGQKIAFFISLLFAGFIGIWFFIDRALLAGSLFFLLAFESYKSWKTSLLLSNKDQDINLQQLVKEAEEERRQGNREGALEKFLQIRTESQYGVLHLMATESAAVLMAEKNDDANALLLLQSLKDKISLKGLNLLHHLLFKEKAWQKAITVGDRIFRMNPNSETAIINAICYASLGQVKPCLGWLQSIIQNGQNNIHEIIRRKEFDPVRLDPQFQKFSEFLPR